MHTPLYREDIALEPCSGCGAPACECRELQIGQHCHPNAGLKAIYHSSGQLEIKCFNCDASVVILQIATRRD